jgi:hypothetical protein
LRPWFGNPSPIFPAPNPFRKSTVARYLGRADVVLPDEVVGFFA